MLPELPDLPFDKYHRFIVSLGALVALLSLFLDTTFVSNRTAFEMGAVAVGFGLLGWVIELFWSAYSRQKNIEWQHVIRQTPHGESPYENMSGGRMGMVYVVVLSRLLVVGGLVAAEAWIYLSV